MKDFRILLFRILPEVADDVAEAANWYDREGFPGLGDRFLATFYASIVHRRRQEKFIGEFIPIIAEYFSSHSRMHFTIATIASF
jgi:hypothetical protein